MPPDDLTAALRPIKNRAAIAYASPRACSQSQADVPVLVAALEAVLKLADDWAREGEGPIWRLDDEDAGERMASREHATALREAITREITGKRESDA